MTRKLFSAVFHLRTSELSLEVHAHHTPEAVAFAAHMLDHVNAWWGGLDKLPALDEAFAHAAETEAADEVERLVDAGKLHVEVPKRAGPFDLVWVTWTP